MKNFKQILPSCHFNKTHLICKQPVELPCRFTTDKQYSCYECLVNKINHGGVYQCHLCDAEHRLNLTRKPEVKNISSKVSDECIIQDLHNLVDLANLSLTSLQERMFDNPETDSYTFKTLFEFLKFEIELRVESLKFELENKEQDLHTVIDKFKSAQNTKIQNQKIDLSNNSDKLRNLNAIDKLTKLQLIETDHIKFDQELNECQTEEPYENLSGLKKVSVNSSNVGYLYGTVNSLNTDRITNSKVEIIDMRNHLQSVCGLSEIFFKENPQKFTLAVTDFAANDIKFLEKYEHFLMDDLSVKSIVPVEDGFRHDTTRGQIQGYRKITEYYAICNSSMDPCTDPDGESVYVCDMELHRVLIFDLNFVRLKRIVSGTRDKLEFECPRDICYYRKYFYVLDQGALSVDKFTHTGDFVDSFYFNETTDLVMNPWSVRVHENTMAIIDWKQKICIFDLNKVLRHVIDQPAVCSICFISNDLIGSLQLFAHSENGDLRGYEIGKVIEPRIIYEENLPKLKYRSEFMTYASNQRFLMSFGWAKAIAVAYL